MGRILSAHTPLKLSTDKRRPPVLPAVLRDQFLLGTNAVARCLSKALPGSDGEQSAEPHPLSLVVTSRSTSTQHLISLCALSHTPMLVVPLSTLPEMFDIHSCLAMGVKAGQGSAEATPTTSGLETLGMMPSIDVGTEVELMRSSHVPLRTGKKGTAKKR
ncbi:hypothetical protein KIPB_004488 [Kipferlia bialata]|uniref:Uncharacterized protein n=1 Tax=Kipferlia bialata TaxID=797122 RepID=A0A9K3CX18_9EUKA|nr:hypothetical protein KIPB_004488 [Kipferlia bialata]|eukprot:g4488.t1